MGCGLFAPVYIPIPREVPMPHSGGSSPAAMGHGLWCALRQWIPARGPWDGLRNLSALHQTRPQSTTGQGLLDFRSLSGLPFHRRGGDCGERVEKDVEIHKNLVVIAERIWYSGFCLILDEMAGKTTSLSRGCAAPAGVACPIWNALLVPQEALLSGQRAGEWLCGKPLRHCGTAWHGSCGCPIGAVDLWVLAELPGH